MPDEPLKHLNACHRRIEERLATLKRAIPFLQTRRGEALAAIDAALRFFATNGVLHTQDEELSLFPRLRPRLTATELALLASLESQHEEVDALHRELEAVVARLAAHDPVAQPDVRAYERTVNRLSALYRDHIAAEDAHFPNWGRRILSEAELAAIGQEMKQRRGLSDAKPRSGQ